MKKIIYGLLITTSVIGSTGYATQASQRPTTPVPTTQPTLKTDNSICPDELNMTQLNEIKAGTLKLGAFKFELHTSKGEFDAMLPGKLQFASKKHSVAKISEGQVIAGRTLIPTPQGRILKCTYTFRTALASKTGGDHTTFAIKSEPTEFEKEPAGLAEAIMGGKSSSSR